MLFFSSLPIRARVCVCVCTCVCYVGKCHVLVEVLFRVRTGADGGRKDVQVGFERRDWEVG